MIKKSLMMAALALLLPFLLAAAPVRADEPFTSQELERFLTDFPAFTQKLAELGLQLDDFNTASPLVVGPEAEEAEKYLATRGWEPDRFSYVMDHIMSGYMRVNLTRRGISPTMGQNLPEEELHLIEQHLDRVQAALLAAQQQKE